MINYLPLQKNKVVMSASYLNRRLPVVPLSDTLSDTFMTEQTLSWQTQMANVVTDVDELLAILHLTHIKPTIYLPSTFHLRVPHSFVKKMQVGEADDPLLKQVLPVNQEKTVVAGYSADPLAENVQNPIKGLLHKYQSRVLITVTGACAVHCRYCFRQHFDYQANLPTQNQLQQIQDYILDYPKINEVILSGGDPLTLSPRRLNTWLQAFESIEQIHTIRLHTRLPVLIPERLDRQLNKRLSDSRCQIVLVIHTNHSNEIDSNTAWYLRQSRDYGITLLNQAVLLRGINDTVTEQVNLSRRLFDAGVLPYYLHMLDKVAGSAHFLVDKTIAVALYWKLLEQLPGYLVPKLVEELPLKPYKTPVNLYS